MALIKRSYSIVSFLVIMVLLIPTVSAWGQAGGPAVDLAGGAKNRINVKLQADGAPLPGGTARLSIDATPLIDAPDLEIQWIVPAGVELQGEPVESMGAVTAHQTTHGERAIKFPSAGTYKIAVVASYHPGKDITLAASGVLFFVIDPTGSRVSDKDPDVRSPMHSKMKAEVTQTNVQPNSPSAPTGDPCFTVTGQINRIDKPPSPSGLGSNVTIPVRNAKVDIRESDTVFDDSYGDVITDNNGNFFKSFCDDDGLFDDTLEIYVRLRAEVRSGGTTVGEVEDSSWIDEVYEYDSGVVSSGGGTVNFNIALTDEQSGIFNILDGIFAAWTYWREAGGVAGNGANFGESAEVHWEAGYGDSGSYYNSFWEEITIADDPSDPDQWDDAVIMHEWGHSADDEYSCDDNPGGQHFVNALVSDPELSWGEGYPDYWQSAARAAKGFSSPNFYIDANGAGSANISINLETWDTSRPTLVSTLNEFAIAAALWDLNDNANDGQDTISYGHDTIQNLYTSDAFTDEAYGFFDDTCDFDTFMRAWVKSGRASDAQTAAVILQNTAYTLPPATLNAQAAGNLASTNLTDPTTIYRWWNQLTYVGDNSASMAGPKYDAMKTLFAEAVNDLGNDPKGTEFTLEQFNNTSPTNQVAFAGQFFPSTLVGPINSLTPSGAADLNCPVFALSALSQAADNKTNGDMWLFTDGDNDKYQTPSVDAIRQLLNERQLRTSVALMGTCPILNETASPAGLITTDTLQSLSPAEQQVLMNERLLPGRARAALGPMADDIPGGLVPYLLTALNSGGQFLYVDSSQVNNAADILRAQITNSAGAGRWSDYVSDEATYRYDTLASFEYSWIEASDGTYHGNPNFDSYINIPLPAEFSFYNIPYSSLNVFQDGFVSFGDHLTPSPDNTPIPFYFEPNNTLDVFWDDLVPLFIIPKSGETLNPDDDFGAIFSKQAGDWFVLQYNDYLSSDVANNYMNTFEILLNPTTGEIRYQYLTVPYGGAAGSTIGIENDNGFSGIQVSYNDISGASDGTGYKFTPAPPQPSKTYTVTVDSTMQSVGFLLTGYNGSFEPLAVTDPDGNLINCSDTGVLCLDLDLVQYIQVNTNGRNGDWHATVDAGLTGSGTYSFISFAASPISVKSNFDHTISTIGKPLLLDLSQGVDGNTLTGHFNLTNGGAFGSTFSFFDDGAHGDGQVGDGLFGSDPFVPPGAASAYLWVDGLIGGEAFIRSDPVPYTFTTLEVTSLGDGDNFGDVTTLAFKFDNQDSAYHCYWLSYDAPEGWRVDLGFFPIVCANAGSYAIGNFDVYMTADPTNNLPSGTTGIVTISATELEKGEISDSASARVTRHRNAAEIQIHNPTFYLRPGGDKTTLDFMVVDDQGVPVSDSTSVALTASSGTISPTIVLTKGGFFQAEFTSDATTGDVTITAQEMNGVTASTVIEVGNPKPSQISLSTSANNLPADGTSTATLVATVLDRYGTPMPNQTVHIGVEGDAQFGTISGGEVVTGTTDVNGEFTAIFTSGTQAGEGAVRAELLYDKGAGLEVVQEAREVILIGLGLEIFLPMINR